MNYCYLELENIKGDKNMMNYELLIQNETIDGVSAKKSIFEKMQLTLGVLLIIAGLLWLGESTGLLPSEYFGPILTIAAGIVLLFIYFAGKSKNKYECWISSLDWKKGGFFGCNGL
jgi:hypothetical protein